MREYAVALWGRWIARPEEHSSLDGQRIMVAGGRDVGCVAALPRTYYLDVDKLYVAPNHRRQGIGSAVLKIVLAEAAALNLPVRLTVLTTNPAFAFYLRHGFCVWRRRQSAVC